MSDLISTNNCFSRCAIYIEHTGQKKFVDPMLLGRGNRVQNNYSIVILRTQSTYGTSSEAYSMINENTGGTYYKMFWIY